MGDLLAESGRRPLVLFPLHYNDHTWHPSMFAHLVFMDRVAPLDSL